MRAESGMTRAVADSKAPDAPRRVVHLVPHTHWDREWYRPFQSFRMKLVELIDGVLDELESDPRFAFTLDGQLATVDDYLEIRPASEERLRSQIASGRLAIGPWQILMDEFLVSGETMVRNLERGWRRAEELGEPMRVGYLPDMFGHVAQMPQILRRAGIGDAVVWRGVPAAIRHHAFRWRAPDGSEVRTEYLFGGYGNAVSLLVIPERLAAKLEIFDEAMRPYFGDDELLAMYGTDHSSPLPGLVELVERMNREQDRYEVRIETLADYVRATDGDPSALPEWDGEMRSAARANMLMGVTSTRIGIKAASARAERALLRYAEPMLALFGDAWPDAYLGLAWDRVIANSAHDSICGCSVDAVADQVMVRFAEAEQIAAGLVDGVTRSFAERLPRGRVAVFNPSPEPRRSLVEVDLAIPDDWGEVELEVSGGERVATQELSRNAPLVFRAEVPGRSLATELFRRAHGRELFGRRLNGWQIETLDGTPTLTVAVDVEEDPAFLDLDELRRELDVAVRAAPDTWGLRIVAAPRRRLAAIVPAPALGWTEARAVAARPARVRARDDEDSDVWTDEYGLGNGAVEARIAADGTFELRGAGRTVAGAGRLVDGGDFGDSYNYAPPAADITVDRPDDVAVRVEAPGPLQGRLRVERMYRWPVGVAADGSARSVETTLVRVVTHLELRRAEPFLRIRVAFDNPCDDHRVRFHVPLPEPAAGSSAEGQFAIVERGLEPEGGYGERPLATYPASTFVDAGGLAVLLDHVTEYEVVRGTALALTVLRSTGLISRNVNPYRLDPAGPEIAIPGAQSRGPVEMSFALFPHAGAWHAAGVPAAAERYLHPFLLIAGTSTSGGELATGDERLGAGFQLLGDGIALVGLRRREGALEARLVSQHPESRTVDLAGAFGEWRHADLLGRPQSAWQPAPGRLSLTLSPWEIGTIQLR